MDRAESVAIAELRQAVIRATEDAAGAPSRRPTEQMLPSAPQWTTTRPSSTSISNSSSTERSRSRSRAPTSNSMGRRPRRPPSNGSTGATATTSKRRSIAFRSRKANRRSHRCGRRHRTHRRRNGGQPVTERRELSVTVGTPLYQLKTGLTSSNHSSTRAFSKATASTTASGDTSPLGCTRTRGESLLRPPRQR